MSTVSVAPAVTTWTADPVHSTANFAVKHMVVATFRGGFEDVTGTLDLAGEQPAVTGAVSVASVRVKDENLYGHLQSPDFFDAERTPQITFASTAVTRGEGSEVTVEGDLTIKGTTLRVRATGEWVEVEADVTGNPRVGLDLETVVDRTAYGLNWNAPLPKGGVAVANDVTLHVHLEFVPAEA
jgi:polyisoprenoid-binding protein YceI